MPVGSDHENKVLAHSFLSCRGLKPRPARKFLRQLLLFCSVLASLLGLFIVKTSAQKPKILAPHKRVAPRLPRHREWDKPAVSQSLVGGYWMTDANFRSDLQLGNGVKTDSITVTPILHLSNGVQYTLAPVTLEPSGTAVVNINRALADQGIATYATLAGYIEVEYQWPWAAICATVRDVDTVHSLIFTSGLQPPPAPAAAPSSEGVSPSPQVLEGMWWKQESDVTGFLALSNITAKPIAVSVQVTDADNNNLGKHDLTVTPHGTKTVNLTELLGAATSVGGVLLTQDGPDGGLVVNGGLEDEAVGYSAHLPVLPLKPVPSPGSTASAPAQTQETAYAELGLMAGAADPMMNFPAGTVFAPYAIVRNVSSQPFSVTPTLW